MLLKVRRLLREFTWCNFIINVIRSRIPSSTAITADIGNGNYRCSSASGDIGQYRPDIAVLPEESINL